MMNRMQHWNDVRKLWNDWQYYEAADRGYNFQAASAARDEFYAAKSFYEAWHGLEWVEPK